MERATGIGFWQLTLLMVVIASWLLYRYVAPRGWREWSRAGLVEAFIRVPRREDPVAPRERAPLGHALRLGRPRRHGGDARGVPFLFLRLPPANGGRGGGVPGEPRGAPGHGAPLRRGP